MSFAQGAGAAAPWILSPPDLQQVDLAILKRRIHLARSAEAYVAPLDKWFLRALDESRLRAEACRLSTDDPARVADLVKILDESDLQSASFSPSGFDPRELIYLRLSNGETMKILLQRAGAPQSTTGTIDYKQISVSTKAAEDLYRWVADSSTSSGCSPSKVSAHVGVLQRRDN